MTPGKIWAIAYDLIYLTLYLFIIGFGIMFSIEEDYTMATYQYVIAIIMMLGNALTFNSSYLNWCKKEGERLEEELKNAATKSDYDISYNDLREMTLDQAVKIKKLEAALEKYVDEIQRRVDWLADAKAKAGYKNSASFDDVWADVLRRAELSSEPRNPRYAK